jgi:hypothetical protein
MENISSTLLELGTPALRLKANIIDLNYHSCTYRV